MADINNPDLRLQSMGEEDDSRTDNQSMTSDHKSLETISTNDLPSPVFSSSISSTMRIAKDKKGSW
ncbi:hypothetical protein BGX24_004166, partial [Mortierella sp. AD032]